MKPQSNVYLWIRFLAVLLIPTTSYGTELFPGRIRNPPGLQWDMNAVYNSSQDEYLLAYSDGRALVGHLTPEGLFYGELAVSHDTSVTHVALAYNPDADQYLFVWSDGSTNNIHAIYLATDGNPIGSSFLLGNGETAHVDYSPVSKLYIVIYSETVSNIQYIRYVMIDGVSSTATPVVRGGIAASNNVWGGQVHWGGTSDKFLVAYVKDLSPSPRQTDIYGRFITADGTGLSDTFGIDIHNEKQMTPRIAYADDIDRWLVAFEDWSEPGTLPNVKGKLVGPDGDVKASFLISRTLAWDVPGPVIYNPSTKSFASSWRSSQADSTESWVQEIDPFDGSASSVPLGDPVLLSDLDAGPLDAAARTHSSDPQVLVLWRVGFGEDGIHAGIFHLRPARPQIHPSMPDGIYGISYVEKITVSGGELPFTYEILSGLEHLTSFGLAPAADFVESGIVTGSPSRLGTTAPFTVRVTDANARFDEKQMTLTVTLLIPTPSSPSGGIHTAKPLYVWSISPGAYSYHIVVENVTDGGTVVDQAVPSSPFVSPRLATGKKYQWKLSATDGAHSSEYSSALTFDVIDDIPAVGGSITGVVSDASTSAPLRGSLATIFDLNGDLVYSVSTDSYGSYEADNLTEGTYFISTWNHLGYRDELFDDIPCPAGGIVGCEPTTGNSIVVTEGTATTDIDFQLMVYDLILTDESIADAAVFEAASSITVGPAFSIVAAGDVTFRAGERIILRNGFAVTGNARFRAEIVSSFVR